MEVKTFAATAEAVKTYSFRVGQHGELTDYIGQDLGLLDDDAAIARATRAGHRNHSTSTAGSPSEALDRAARDFMDKIPGLFGNYSAAIERVLSMRPDLARAYAAEDGGRVRTYTEHGGDTPGEEATRKVKRLMEREPDLSYADAAARVLRENPSLAGQWANYVSAGKIRRAS